MKFIYQYRGVKQILSTYWSAYGGISAFIRSPYLHISYILSIILFPIWTENHWWEEKLDILSTLFGFTLGGYAIFVAFGDDVFRSLISKKLPEIGTVSPFMAANSAFVHFLVVQFSAIIFMILIDANYFDVIRTLISTFDVKITDRFNTILDFLMYLSWFLSFFFFIYALLSDLASVFAIFRVAKWFDDYHA